MAAQLTSEPTPVQHIQHERFTTEQHGYRLWDISLNLSGNIAVSGNHYNSKRTFIDLYFGWNSVSRDKVKLFYSKEFEKYSNYWRRYVSFLEKNGSELLVTCIGDKIDIIDTKNESKVLRSCRVNSETRCLAVREGEIFIGLLQSQTVIVFNNDLKETKKIKLKGKKDGDSPWDLQVIKDTVFVRTVYGRALSIAESNGSIITEYTDTTGTYEHAYSTTVNERLGLVAVLWGLDRIIVYSLNENKSFLVFDVDHNAPRIRISDRDRMIITGNRDTGEIKMYDLEQLFSFEAMKRTLAYIVSPDECEELRKYFGITEEELSQRGVGDESKKLSEQEKKMKKMECLLTIIEEKGHLNPYNINDLTDAVSTLGDEMHVSNLKGPMEGYVLLGIFEVNVKNLMAETTTRQKAWKDERNQLSSKLETAERKVKEHQIETEALHHQLDLVNNESAKQIATLTEELEQTKQSLDLSKKESAKEITTLTEELEQTKQSLDLSKKESAKQITTLTEELEQTIRESYNEIETLAEELKKAKQSFYLSRTESTRRIATLTDKLAQTRLESTTKTETLQRELEWTKQVLSKTTEDRNHTKAELKQYQLDFAKESKAMKEVLNQTKEAIAELQKRTVEDKSSIDSEETRDEDVLMLTDAAEFGRLNVAVAEYLTLDHCLKLATLFNVPPLECDMVRRVSFIESPGIKLLDLLKIRNVINIYDVTNLQKGLKMSHLNAVNNDLLVPYQESIDDNQYKLHKAEEMFTWEEVDVFVRTVKEDTERRRIGDSLISTKDDTEPDKTSQGEARDHSEDKGTLLSDRRHELYIEQNIGREGGTIRLANVALTIPPNAISESHVIALTVMNESPFPLDREVDSARMTPLIKLEPLGLKFKKSLQLNIPHFAFIPETESHNVIIYSGQISKDTEDSSDYVQWTVERSTSRQLKEKSVTVDIERLSYLSASLVSQASVPSCYNLRALLFVDGVRNIYDDITLTICFCSDNDSVYKMLLSDYKTKLPLEQYSTLQLRRHSESDKDDVGFLKVTVLSVNNTYVPYAEGVMKQFAISHLCTASRVSHQLRLQKNQDVDRDVVDIVLTFSQAEYTTNELFLQARIKDLVISQETEDLLTGTLPPAFKPYEDLKANISLLLETDHCYKLATYFELSPAEAEKIQTDAAPGRILMKILDEREKIMPCKMIGLFQGLKACHLDKIARMVVEYINENSKETQQERSHQEERNVKGISVDTTVSQRSSQKQQTRRSRSNKSVQTIVTASCSSSGTLVKTMNQEVHPDGTKTSDTLTPIHLSAQTPLGWIKEHRGLMFYLLLMSVDGLLQTHRGVFTLPRWFKN